MSLTKWKNASRDQLREFLKEKHNMTYLEIGTAIGRSYSAAHKYLSAKGYCRRIPDDAQEALAQLAARIEGGAQCK
ncbi:hypothetical protein [Pseudodesulfovibrio sp.]|uniref:hypothetical protein n=1 Tax=Pseudodesulfovibrio sp. TaxID=2035812 RepID=UPI002604894F|nr:hypothetical protein [Pseudodesulfovibrio sp.]MDD3313189.1 hypothetical protein [Pseudodesulfovibrio sp.]